jgi:hypothetical protein
VSKRSSMTLYTGVRVEQLARILATGFHEGDESNCEPGDPLIGVIFCYTPEAWEDGIETGRYAAVAVTLELPPAELRRYEHDSFWWIPAHRLRDATIRHHLGPFLA